MQRFSPRAQVAIVSLLCGVAGFVDAIAYLRADVFVANMTGNTVLIGISAATQDWHSLALRVSTVGVFFLGAVLGRLCLSAADGRQWVPLALEVALIAMAATLALPDWLWVMSLAAAMGIQATAATQFGGVAINTVVVTSAVARVAERLADRVRPAGSANQKATPMQGRLQFAAWASYVAGAAAAAFLRSVPWSLLLPAVALSILIARLTRRA